MVRIHRGHPLAGPGPVALTVGTFDGLHRGHQAMLARLGEAADDLALPPAVLTFEPHPREYFIRDAAPPRLSTTRDKFLQLSARGVEHAFIARFDCRLASLSATDFINEVLVKQLQVRWVLVGDDFRFGKGRAGDIDLLRRLARTFSVEAMATVSVDGTRVSSSAVRSALAAADFALAAKLLGRPFTIDGRVVHGTKLGRDLGVPTANLPLKRPPPISGIFAVRVHGLGPVAYPGVANVGVRPTVVQGGAAVLEVYIFDFSETIYGRHLTVEFVHKLREEARYPDLETLKQQIDLDIAQARALLAA